MQCLTRQTFKFQSPQASKSDRPFRVVANRYTPSQNAQEEGISLILVHANGTHKELWEPMLAELFSIQQCRCRRPVVREAWALDGPGYGDSAVLNASTHADRVDDMLLSEFGEAVATIARSPHLHGRKIVIIGHSLGATATMYSTKLFPQHEIPYAAIILIETVLIDRDVFYANMSDRIAQIGFLMNAIRNQKSIWDSREAAYEWLRRRRPWREWDERALMIYVEYGLKPTKDGRITTKGTKMQESCVYGDLENPFQALDQIAKLCKRVPIHLVFGSINDLVPRYSQDTVSDPTKGRYVASLTRIADAGHMASASNTYPRDILKLLCRWYNRSLERRRSTSIMS
ncbi:Alpha/Beta hydrolase protein [Cyathus striatus]|nr:Alpha/Beta hydrolase protein [Cyathus striatus]